MKGTSGGSGSGGVSARSAQLVTTADATDATDNSNMTLTATATNINMTQLVQVGPRAGRREHCALARRYRTVGLEHSHYSAPEPSSQCPRTLDAQCWLSPSPSTRAPLHVFRAGIR